MKWIRISRSLVVITIGLILLTLWSYYYDNVITLFSLPDYAAPTVSIFLLCVIIFLILRNNRENEILKNEFMAIVAHKFRTPLTAIRWSTEMLKSEVTYKEKQILLERLRSANDKLSEIVDLLVNFVKYDKGLEYAYKATSFREMVFESLKRFAEITQAKKITLSIEPMTSIPLLVIDEAKIQFVIDTIIDNALKYTPESGKIDVSVTQNDTSIFFTVTDSGIGIGSRDSRRILKRFFRGEGAKKMDTEGLGLGLYTAKRIIHDHGGKIKIESKGENTGTKVTVAIPKN